MKTRPVWSHTYINYTPLYVCSNMCLYLVKKKINNAKGKERVTQGTNNNPDTCNFISTDSFYFNLWKNKPFSEVILWFKSFSSGRNFCNMMIFCFSLFYLVWNWISVGIKLLTVPQLRKTCRWKQSENKNYYIKCCNWQEAMTQTLLDFCLACLHSRWSLEYPEFYYILLPFFWFLLLLLQWLCFLFSISKFNLLFCVSHLLTLTPPLALPLLFSAFSEPEAAAAAPPPSGFTLSLYWLCVCECHISVCTHLHSLSSPMHPSCLAIRSSSQTSLSHYSSPSLSTHSLTLSLSALCVCVCVADALRCARWWTGVQHSQPEPELRSREQIETHAHSHTLSWASHLGAAGVSALPPEMIQSSGEPGAARRHQSERFNPAEEAQTLG